MRYKSPAFAHQRQLKLNNLKLKLLAVKGLKPKTNFQKYQSITNLNPAEKAAMK